MLEPGDGKPYERDPRSLAKRAEAYLKASGIGDAAFFGPEPEFFIFDEVRWNVDMSGCFVKIDSEEAPWSTGKKIEGGNLGHRPGRQGRLLPGAAGRQHRRTCAAEMCLLLEQLGIPVEVHHHEVAAPARTRSAPSSRTLVQRADWTDAAEVRDPQRRAMPTARRRPSCPSRSSATTARGMHVHQSVWKDGKNLFAGDGYAGLSEFALYYIGGIIKHARALNAITNPGTNSYKRLVPGFEAPVKLAYSAAQPLGLGAHPVRRQPEGPAHRSALPRSHLQPVPGVHAPC